MLKGFVIFILFFIPQVLLASEGKETFFDKYFWLAVVNFTIYVAMLYYFLKRPTIDFFKNRRKEMEKEASDAAKLLEETRNQLEEYKNLVEHIDDKVKEIKDYTVKTEEKEVEMMLRAAEAYAEKIKEDAKRIAQQESEKAIQKLRSEVADLAVEVAEKSLQKIINGEIQEKLVDETIERVKKVSK